jgi:hypothetical protein
MRTRVSRVVAGLAIGLSLALVVPVGAGADPGSRHAARVYRAEVRGIDHQYRVAVAAAKRTLVAELAVATNAGQRSTARARYSLAIVVASTARDQELVLLGVPPHGYIQFSPAPSGTHPSVTTTTVFTTHPEV